jgi:hypothetical protein
MDKPAAERRILLRGYVKQLNEHRFVGVCLTLNLVVEESTFERTHAKLEALINAYLSDVIEKNEFDAFVPRRAPASFYLEYLVGRMLLTLRSIKGPFYPFSNTRPVPRHA